MKSSQIRKVFLDFFKSKGHKIYPSSSLVPDDRTMLLTTAGMVQFKPVFEGALKPKHRRIATVQKSARTTDIDRVGYTARHLTFFEMLGNFSFGDYYKKEAINWAWELITNHFKINKKNLWATVYTDDDEAFSIWENDIDIDKNKIARLGKEHNFWSAGEVGPCGPSSEIFYDFGEDKSCGKDCAIGCDCDRWLEIWNLVFMQFERAPDGSFSELPDKNIDTGMGLERIAAILQNAEDNFHTDILGAIMNSVSKLSGVKLSQSEKSDVSLKIITDHSRAIAFLIADGVVPSNEGRGYVLRRLIRRAIRHGWLLGVDKPFIDKPLKQVIKLMSNPYTELNENRDYILRIASSEEENFGQTLRQGMEIIEDSVKELKKNKKKIISGDLSFKLHDTYGFPVELTAEIASEHNLSLDMMGFEKLMTEQKKRARASWKEEERKMGTLYNEVAEQTGSTEFVGYFKLETEASVKGLIVNDKIAKVVKSGQEVELILDKTPFYTQKGGQVTDTGKISSLKGEAKVYDVKEGLGEIILHKAKVLKGTLSVGDKIKARVDTERRLGVMRAHTATHLLQWALRKLFGTHIKQAGSLVEDDRLRFDFTHFEALTQKQINKIEDLVNSRILENSPVKAYTTTIEYAKEIGAMAFFGEKYGDFVRVVEAGDFSKELCGGTHVRNTAFINLFKITHESSIGASIRRIEAYTGNRLFNLLRKDEGLIKNVSVKLKAEPSSLESKVNALDAENKKLKKDLEKAKKGDIGKQIDKVAEDAKSFNGVKVLTYRVADADIPTLRDYSDVLRSKLGNSIVMLASEKDGKALVVAAASKSAVKMGFDASNWLNEILPLIKGRGGGRPQFAQAGGGEVKQISQALKAALDYASKWAKARK